MRRTLLLAAIACPLYAQAADPAMVAAIARDYDSKLAPLFDYFHRNPELSYMEVKTAARLAQVLREAGYEVTTGVGKTGVVAILKNGPGPMAMLRADMDALPVLEKTGLPYASTVVMKDDSGRLVPVAHACGHDIHMTSMVGTALQMAARRSQWSGTLMLIGQPAEERGGGGQLMMDDRLWARFGKPDVALALHVSSEIEAGKIDVSEAPYSGVDSLEITVHGVGAHGASAHTGRDPVVIGAQIVLALQTIISRELAPREPGLITVGSFHAGTKANIISDVAKLELSVRTESPQARAMILKAITRVAVNTARAAGVAEDRLPEVKVIDPPSPPIINNAPLSARLKGVWQKEFGAGIFSNTYKRAGMGAEDFSSFTTAPYIPSVYYRIGGTPEALLVAAARDGVSVPSNHSPLFKAVPDASIKTGVATSTVALLELLKK
jgi:hippurate hydrolase